MMIMVIMMIMMIMMIIVIMVIMVIMMIMTSSSKIHGDSGLSWEDRIRSSGRIMSSLGHYLVLVRIGVFTPDYRSSYGLRRLYALLLSNRRLPFGHWGGSLGRTLERLWGALEKHW